MLADHLLDFFNKYVPDFRGKKYLLTVSGGMDSILLLHLFHAMQLNFEVAHCNFHLRGEESNDDEHFVSNLCNTFAIPFHIRHFDVLKEKEATHEGTQLIARHLRYEWFEELYSQGTFDFICTAHHQRDNVETLLYRFMLGAYPESMQGMKPLNGHILRPLLFIPYNQLVTFAGDNRIAFRTDSSNKYQDYIRNKIRHSVLPVLQNVFGEEYEKNLENMALRYAFYFDFIKQQAAQLLIPNRFWFEIKIVHLLEAKGNTALLYEAIKNHGFNWIQCEDICSNLYRLKGSFYENDERSFRLFFTHEMLQLVPVRKTLPESVISVDDAKRSRIEFPDITLSFQIINKTELQEFESGILYFNADLLKNKKITVRFWEAGDHFTPLGMHGRKSVADFLKDKGVSPAEKEYSRVICCEGQVIGIAGYRIDDNFKIIETTQKVLAVRASHLYDEI